MARKEERPRERNYKSKIRYGYIKCSNTHEPFWSFCFFFRRPTIDPIYLANREKLKLREKKAARRSVTTHRREMRAHLSQSEELILFCRGRQEKVRQKIVDKDEEEEER
jgi:hypothetical protein